METAAFEELFQGQVSALLSFQQESQGIRPTVIGRKVFQRLEGIRQDGSRDYFLAVIDATEFPLYPFDVGFVDPAIGDAGYGKIEGIKNPVWFPYDGETKFKTAFKEDPRVFVCIQPGFSKEYFVHHKNEQWNPHDWTLSRTVHQIQLALREPTYQCPNWERV